MNRVFQHRFFIPSVLAAAALAQLIFVLTYTVNMIFIDEFDCIPLLQHFSLGECIRQHNEHRIFFPNLVFTALARLTHWDVRVETAAGWGILQCGAVILYGILKSAVPPRRHGAAALAVVFFLVPQYYHNLLWGIQLCVQISLVSFLAAALVLLKVRRPWLRLHMAAVCCIVSMYSFSYGFFSWIALIPLLITGDISSVRAALHGQRRQLVYWFGLAFLAAAIYCTDYRVSFSNHAPTAYPWTQPLEFVRYFFTALGAPLIGAGPGLWEKFPYLYVAAGVFLCALPVAGYALGILEINKTRPHLCLVIFVLLSALVLTWGRLNFGMQYAITSRFREANVLLPVALLAMYAGAGGAKNRAFRDFALAFLVLGMCAGFLGGWRYAILEGRGWHTQQTESRRILASFETASDADIRRMYPDAGKVRAWAVFLREKRYGVFY